MLMISGSDLEFELIEKPVFLPRCPGCAGPGMDLLLGPVAQVAVLTQTRVFTQFSLPPSGREEDRDILWLFEEDAQLIVTTFVTVFICISSKPLTKPSSCLCCPSSRDHGNAGRTISPSGRGHRRASNQPAGPAAHSAGHTSPSRDKGTR